MNLKDNNSGLSLLLTVLILSSVLIVSLAASDLVIRVGQDSRKIGSSEVAYYAAESAAEDTLYYIEQLGYGVTGFSASDSLDNVSATWSRSVSANTQAPSIIESDDSIWTDSVGDITDINPLKVKLTHGSSFEIDLNIQGVGNNYPSVLTIDWLGSGSQVIIYNQTLQTQEDTYDTSPATVNSLNNQAYRVRIINNSGSTVIYTLSPTSDDPLPIGIIISTTGYFLDQERRLELESKKWQIY